MTQKEKNQVERLAVAYHSFQEANNTSDTLGIRVWGDILLTLQQKLGIVMVEGLDERLDNLSRLVRAA